MQILNKISKHLKEQKKTQKELCEYLGIEKTAFSDWKSGKSNSYKKYLPQISDFLNVSIDYLLDKETIKKTGVSIPVFGDVAAGIPISAIEDTVDTEEITEEMASKGEYFGLMIKGDSMEPRFTTGDVVIVRQQDTAETGDIAIVMIGNENATCKKIKRTPEGVMLISTNPNYEPMFFTNKQIEELPVKILGKVVELRAKF
ncbi:MAG: helix-turn-helix domain-containing protein [Ruminococcaceae bacterium]|nr:helix-turn-helix domain-containing protein [Oscillospiraceae bacterium]